MRDSIAATARGGQLEMRSWSVVIAAAAARMQPAENTEERASWLCQPTSILNSDAASERHQAFGRTVAEIVYRRGEHGWAVGESCHEG